MQREIKFRGWDRLHDKFHKVQRLMIDESGHCYGVLWKDSEGQDYQGINFVNLCQFTGLHDKNGKEVYEGDLTICYSKSGEVVYRHHVISIPLVYQEIWGNQDDAQIEVIGNIHENPELLTNK
jgi:uncharacterized phage protein (TIGR01671 family)